MRQHEGGERVELMKRIGGRGGRGSDKAADCR